MYVVSLASTSPEVLAAHRAEIWSSLDARTQVVYGEAYLSQLYANFQSSVLTYPSDISPVVAAMRTALLSRRPAARYAVGRGTRTLMCLMTILPSWITDRLSVAINATSHDIYPAKLLQQQSSGDLVS